MKQSFIRTLQNRLLLEKKIGWILLNIIIVTVSCSKNNSYPGESIKNENTAKGTIVTPFGRMNASTVMAHSPTVNVGIFGGRLQERDIVSGKVVKDLGIITNANTISQPVGTEQLGTGYTCSAQIPLTDTIKSFKTKWVVPNSPKTSNFTFYWNGMSGGAFAQPVLQWEDSSWTIANWYFLGGLYHHGTFVNVNPGDTVQGIMDLLSHTDTSYTYKIYFKGHPEADQIVTYPTRSTLVYEVLEPAYGGPVFDTSSYLPPDPLIKMFNINLTTSKNNISTLNWIIGGNKLKTASGKNSEVISNSATNGEIDFYFR